MAEPRWAKDLPPGDEMPQLSATIGETYNFLCRKNIQLVGFSSWGSEWCENNFEVSPFIAEFW